MPRGRVAVLAVVLACAAAPLACQSAAAAATATVVPVARCPTTLGVPQRLPSRPVSLRVSLPTAAFQDPPGVHGAGLPSGGRDPANGVMAFTPSNRHVSGYALTETCTLPAAETALCTAVLDNVFGRGR